MIIGNSSELAIEFEITKAYNRPSSKALGYFVVYIRSKAYGVRAPDATLLACSFCQVKKRISNRGNHIATFSSEVDARSIAESAYYSMYFDPPRGSFFGIDQQSFRSTLIHSAIFWAPDGDQAFDDCSFILQFDIGDFVRLIGFKITEKHRVDPASVTDLLIDQNQFYGILEQWTTEFEDTWSRLDKA